MHLLNDSKFKIWKVENQMVQSVSDFSNFFHFKFCVIALTQLLI